MHQDRLVFKKKLAITLASAVALFFLIIFILIFSMYMNSLRQQEELKVTDKFMQFKSEVEQLIYGNKTLVQGYEAYLTSNPNLDEASAYVYLDNLLSKNQNYIRNIGVCKDTTIIWNYPRETNAAAIGVDLAKIEAQKDLVLKVKNEQISVLQGPVNLVQGGTGFIIRLPIVREDTGYWGQISIVLKGDKILEEISGYAQALDLDVALYNTQNQSEPFLKSNETSQSEPLYFEMDPGFINWKVAVTPKDGWADNRLIFACAVLCSIFFSVFAGISIYKGIRTNYQLRLMSIHDSLTGLYNRHFLNEYQELVFTAAQRHDHHIGLMSMDLNCFKKINDTFGHSVGDQVLVETARLLKKITRSDEVVFRLGGDEFLMIMPEIENRQELEQVRERLLESFEAEFFLEPILEKITLSVGVALYPEDGENLDALLQVADEQMYRHKKNQKMEEDCD
jgi:diguanylate cyclase (GGDEF)-like protein